MTTFEKLVLRSLFLILASLIQREPWVHYIDKHILRDIKEVLK